jgi:regulator of sirC expression with transglutaminase-like and TPR domain
LTVSEAEALLRAAGQAEDAAIDLAPTALAFATLARPEAGDDRYREHLKVLAADVAAAAPPGGELSARIDALRAVLIGKHGYQGDRESYDDLRNADLAHVIDRRRGLPVALSILWLHAGRAQGWTMSGLNFPAHFLLRINSDTPGGLDRAIIDPFNEGRALNAAELRALLKNLAGTAAELAPEHQMPVSNRAILLRLQNNIKIRLLQQQAPSEALAVLERMLLIAPKDAGLWHEAGALQATLENLGAALASLRTAANLAADARTRQRIAAEIAALRGKLH